MSTAGSFGGATPVVARQEQIARIDVALAAARSGGDSRRAALLEARRERVTEEVLGGSSGRRAGAPEPEGRNRRHTIDSELAERRGSSPGGSASDVWEDIRAVTEGRKRQFGIGKP